MDSLERALFRWLKPTTVCGCSHSFDWSWSLLGLASVHLTNSDINRANAIMPFRRGYLAQLATIDSLAAHSGAIGFEIKHTHGQTTVIGCHTPNSFALFSWMTLCPFACSHICQCELSPLYEKCKLLMQREALCGFGENPIQARPALGRHLLSCWAMHWLWPVAFRLAGLFPTISFTHTVGWTVICNGYFVRSHSRYTPDNESFNWWMFGWHVSQKC